MFDSRRLLLYPMIPVTVMLIVGMLLADGVASSVSPWVWGGAFGVVVLLSILFHSFAFRYLQSLLALMASLLAGATLMTLQNQRIGDGFASEPCAFEAVVASPVTVKKKSVQMDIIVTSSARPFKVRATLLRDTLAEQLSPGIGLRAFGAFEKPENRFRSSFDYRAYLLRHDYRSTVFLLPYEWETARVSLRSLSSFERFRLTAFKFRQRLVEGYARQGFDDEQLAIFAAMTLGQRQLISPELREAFNVSGGSHVLALSGLHLSILFMVLALVFRFRPNMRRLSSSRRIFSVVVMLVAIWSFVVLVGMSASVVRSAFMLSVFCLMQLLGRWSVSLNVLAFSAACLLCVNPQSLFDVGFQLSFASVASILLFFSPLFHLVYKPSYTTTSIFGHLGRWMWGIVSVSIAAQIGAAPLVAYHFGRIPCYFLLTSFVVIPLAYVIISGAVLFWLLTWWSAAQHVVAVILAKTTSMLAAGMQWIATLPGASIEVKSMNEVGVICCYVVALALLGIYHVLRSKRRVIPEPSELDKEFAKRVSTKRQPVFPWSN